MSIKTKTNNIPVAIVTGAEGGIGLAIVRKLLLQNYIVFACARSKTINLDKLMLSDKENFSKRLFINKFDINDDNISKQFAQEMFRKFQRIDVLVNSAGVPHGNLFLFTKKSEILEIFNTNLFSLLNFTCIVSRLMIRKKRGSIVNISSSTSFSPDSGTIAYGSSKAALNYATKVLSKELASQGIRVNAVAPGVTQTSMLEKMDPNAIDNQLNSSSLKKIANPSEVASVVNFLCSDESSHITGQIIRVDGGQL